MERLLSDASLQNGPLHIREDYTIFSNNLSWHTLADYVWVDQPVYVSPIYHPIFIPDPFLAEQAFQLPIPTGMVSRMYEFCSLHAEDNIPSVADEDQMGEDFVSSASSEV